MTGLTQTFVLIMLQQANQRLRVNNKLAKNDSLVPMLKHARRQRFASGPPSLCASRCVA